jgi:hypothetical protein
VRACFSSRYRQGTGSVFAVKSSKKPISSPACGRKRRGTLSALRLRIDRKLSTLKTARFGVRELAAAFAAGSLLPALGRPSLSASKPPWGKRHQGAALQTLRAGNIFRAASRKMRNPLCARKRKFCSRLRSGHRRGATPSARPGHAQAGTPTRISRVEPLARHYRSVLVRRLMTYSVAELSGVSATSACLPKLPRSQWEKLGTPHFVGERRERSTRLGLFFPPGAI